MQIDRIYYPTKTLGYGNRISIWTIGCPHHCFNCSNPELREPNVGRDIDTNEIVEIIRKYKDCIDGVTITGGDPFFQAKELLNLVKGISNLGIKDILVYTGYLFDDIRASDGAPSEILEYIGVLIDGPYIHELNDNIGIRGSSNQKIYILNKQIEIRYLDSEKNKRESQIIVSENKLISIGIPIKV